MNYSDPADPADPADAVAPAIAAHPELAGHEYVRPRDYCGPDYFGTFAVLGRSRDSSTIEESNYASALARLRTLVEAHPAPADEDENGAWAFDVRDSHWAVGWVETLRVRADAPEDILAAAAGILARLEEYPVLDDEDLSERESELESECWENYGRSEFERAISLRGERLPPDSDSWQVYREHCDGCHPFLDGNSFVFDSEAAAHRAMDAGATEPDPDQSDEWELDTACPFLRKHRDEWYREAAAAWPEHAELLADVLARRLAYRQTMPLPFAT